MADARSFARSRTLRLVVAFCALCALAFALGQGAAAFRATQAQTHTPPQRVERVSGAQGVIPLPASVATHTTATTPSQPAQPAPASAAFFAASLIHVAIAGSEQPQTNHTRQKGKGQHHSAHKNAAAEWSNGGFLQQGQQGGD